MSGNNIIPDWADKKAERVINMFPQGDNAKIDRALLHGAFAAALCEERERCAKIAETLLKVADTTSRADEVIAAAIRWQS